MKEKSAKTRVSRGDRVTRGMLKKHLDMIYWQSYLVKRLFKYIEFDHKRFPYASISVSIHYTSIVQIIAVWIENNGVFGRFSISIGLETFGIKIFRPKTA